MKPDLHLKLTLRLEDGSGQRCFGPGVAALLEGVDVHHSLRAAAGAMGMAYSKAWRIVRTAEDAFGCPLLERTIGGRHGGGAVLTPQARRILSAYAQLRSSTEAYCAQQYAALFPAPDERL